ncbi:hypothetical protein [Enterocloster citroniae]|uniref:Uncharacterized protein n=2 Tax=Enterocloster citroniae TaxID=358743 RepID=A0ABV2G3B5_9FIRM|nr:hypothetical protein [Enterocloster citroniae]KMW23667.1 hypothetical protein HMPREF9470_00883 [[Clostridium] citroniae WAL-19142]MCB7067669.1 hypothetical protein [Enterocloster citroniae]
MIIDSYVVYQSDTAASDMFAAMTYTKLQFENIHYINEETAAANLELAQLKVLAEDPYGIM